MVIPNFSYRSEVSPLFVISRKAETPASWRSSAKYENAYGGRKWKAMSALTSAVVKCVSGMSYYQDANLDYQHLFHVNKPFLINDIGPLRYSIDIGQMNGIEPLPIITAGNSYVIVTVDCLPMYLEAISMASLAPRKLIDFLKRRHERRHGLLKG